MIHLGYEVGTGKAVEIPLLHTAVVGQTQLSGKTTTLEALISHRGATAGLRALTFVTKRGEGAFQNAREIQPYFRERADWQYVAAILEATLREKLKFERSWIMKVCKGARTLADVQRNIERGLVGARGLNESVLTTLHAYLEMVLPQISSTEFAPSVTLEPGVNVMDLSVFSLELQSLIIRSAVEWIYEREQNTVVIIPEAWEFIPQSRGSPVKLAVETLIRKGAGLKNFVWLDSQDLAQINKDVLRSVGVWILGVQRERNEVARTLDHIPGGAAKPKVDAVMELSVGEFFVSFGKHLHKVYVQPAWASAADAQRHAMGGPLPVAASETGGSFFGSYRFETETGRAIYREADKMWKEKYDLLKIEFDRLKDAFDRLEKVEKGYREATAAPPEVARTLAEASDTQCQPGAGPAGHEAVYQYVKKRLLAEKDPGILELLTRQPELRVKVERPVIDLDASTLRGRLARMIADGFFDSPTAGNAAFNELKRIGFPTAKPNVYRELDKLAEMEIVTKEASGYQRAPGAVIKKVGAGA